MASFINKSVFENKAKRRREEEKVLNWSELSQNVIYRIKEVEVIEGGKYGTSYILFLIDIDNTKVKVWASKKLISELERKESYDIPYIVSLGQEPYGKLRQSIFTIKSLKKETKLYLYLHLHHHHHQPLHQPLLHPHHHHKEKKNE